MRHLIIGAGPAGVIAAEQLRKHSPTDEITIIGDEPERPYSRMAIPYLLINNIDEQGTLLRKSAEHFDQLCIRVVRQRVNKVNAAKNQVTLQDGSVHDYDRLLIATGSTPIRPPISGMDGSNVHTCWTLADAREIIKLAKPGAKVVQMGAGFIGCIIMEALASRGVELTVVEMGDRMVPRMMGPSAGGMIKSWCQQKGVRVETSAKVDRIDHVPGGASQVHLSNGVTLQADLVISSTGVKPNIGFLQDSGIDCDAGALTDDRLQTNQANVFAAGDCAQALDHATGQQVVSAIQPNAADQALVAARCMLGLPASLKRVPQINVLDTLGLISSSFGQWQGVAGGQHVETVDLQNFRLLSLQFDQDRLVGCNAIGWTDHVGVMRGLVEGRVRLGPWKDRLLQDPTRLMEAYLACAQAQDQHAAA
jgi:NADPH-dependent 2,4-dienoyl-CoA reductase/sulfur reductase-like enzyme